ncbi:MAG: nucleotidyltransferase family protein [Candidatus Micrarchaeia archaeon]|jgi:NDP-sugar pyrophosphorylase family protein
MEKITQAAVLCGGLGTRLMPLTADRPKPLIKVGGKPMLELVIARLKKSGIKRAIMLTGYKAEMIEEHFGDGSKFGMEIDYSVETKPLGSAGALHQVQGLLDDNFFVCNCDTICNLDFREFFARHEKRGCLATMLFAPVDDVERFGIAELKPDGKIHKFLEKPKKTETKSNLASLQMFALSKNIFARVHKDMFSLEREIFPHLCTEGKIYGEQLPKGCEWVDVGTLADLQRIEKEISQGKHKWLFA